MIKRMIAIVMMLGFAAAAQAGVWLDVVMHVNSIGQDVYVITANSDGSPITSIGVQVQGDWNLGQVHPMGHETSRMDYNPFFTVPTDHDTQMLFSTAADTILTLALDRDTTSELMFGNSGYAPFNSRAIVQIVLTGGEATATIGLVVYGQEYTFTPYAQGITSTLVPEPASVVLLVVGGLVMMRRR